MTSLVAEALDTYVAGQDLSSIAHLIAASERRHTLREAPYAPRPVARTTS
jgi:hypothetical protein